MSAQCQNVASEISLNHEYASSTKRAAKCRTILDIAGGHFEVLEQSVSRRNALDSANPRMHSLNTDAVRNNTEDYGHRLMHGQEGLWIEKGA